MKARIIEAIENLAENEIDPGLLVYVMNADFFEIINILEKNNSNFRDLLSISKIVDNGKVDQDITEDLLNKLESLSSKIE